MKTFIVILLITLSSFAQTNRMYNNYLTAISVGFDPAPLFDNSSTGGLDVNAKLIFGQENRECGMNLEYFHNLHYLSFGVFYDFILIGKGLSYNQTIQGLLGPELVLLNRFSKDDIPGFCGLTVGVNATLRWNISEYIGVEGIINYKYRRDLDALYNEDNLNKLIPMSGRLNIILTLK